MTYHARDGWRREGSLKCRARAFVQACWIGHRGVLMGVGWKGAGGMGNNESYISEKTQLNSRHDETRITRHETTRHDSVCHVLRFRIFTDTFDQNPWF